MAAVCDCGIPWTFPVTVLDENKNKKKTTNYLLAAEIGFESTFSKLKGIPYCHIVPECRDRATEVNWKCSNLLFGKKYSIFMGLWLALKLGDLLNVDTIYQMINKIYLTELGLAKASSVLIPKYLI